MHPAVRVVAIAAASLVYLAGIANPLTTWDDPLYVAQNARILDVSAHGFIELWSPAEALGGKFIEFFPLRDSLYWIVHAVFGTAPWPYHLLSLLLHVVVALLVAALAERVGFSAGTATLAGVLFAAHPVHVEAVQWVASLKDPLYAATLLASLLAYARFLDAPRARSYALAFAFMALSLLSKSFGIVEPILLVALELARPARAPWSRIALRVAPFAVLAALATALFIVVGRANAVIAESDTVARLSAESWCMVKYLALLVVPVGMRTMYYVDPLAGPADARLWIVVVTALAFVGAAAIAWRRDRRAWFWLVFYAAPLLPVANIVPFPALMADRYVYLPSAAFCVLAAFGISSLRPQIARPVVGVTLAVFLFATFVRVRQWADERNLWHELIDDDAGHREPWLKLAEAEAMRGDHDASADAALRARPLPNTQLFAARELLLAGRYEEALAHARASTEEQPSSPEAWDLRARAATGVHDAAGAVAAAEHAAALEPAKWTWRFDLALARAEAGDAAGAATDLDAAVALDPAACARVVAWRAGFGPAHQELVDDVFANAPRAARCAP